MSEDKPGAQASDKQGAGRRRRGRGRGAPSNGSEARKPDTTQPEVATEVVHRSRSEADEDRGGADRRNRRGRRRGGSSDVEELGASSGIDVVEISAERRPREGRLEPGLTLRDLLPFLRPPKSIMVLGASTGGGHNRTAAALTEALKQLDRNLVVRHHDVLELTEGDSTPVRDHLEWLSQEPSLFGTPFGTRPDSPAAEGDAPIDLATIFGANFDHLVVDKRPDHIVCTHWLPLHRLKALKDEGRLKATVSAVIPDPDLHAHWYGDVVGHYIVSHDGLRSRLEARGVDASHVSVCGSPVSPSFLDPVDKGNVCRTMALKPQVPTVLLRPGGVGTTERIVALVKSILTSSQPMNLLVVTGKNERLQEELGGLEVPETSTLKVFGFVQNIHELMGIADLLITRASPHTVAEAQAAGVPMLLLRPSEGVEDRTADRLLRSGMALKVYGEEDLLFLVAELLKNRRRLRDMQDAAQRRRRPDSVRVTVERLASLVR